MTEGKKYKIEKTRPISYMGELDQVINGYSVRVRLFDFDELHEINLPNISPETVSKAVNQLISDREALSNLG